MASRIPASDFHRVTRSQTRAARIESASDTYHQQNRTHDATRRHAARRAILNQRRRSRSSSFSHDVASAIVRNHFAGMRSPRHSTPFHQSPVFKGIRQFNSPIDEEVVTTFAYNDLKTNATMCVLIVNLCCGKRKELDDSVAAVTVKMRYTN